MVLPQTKYNYLIGFTIKISRHSPNNYELRATYTLRLVWEQIWDLLIFRAITVINFNMIVVLPHLGPILVGCF